MPSTPPSASEPAPPTACRGLAAVPPLELELLDGQIRLEVPMGVVGAEPLGGTGVPLSIVERPLGPGARVVFWATRFPTRLGDPLDPAQIVAPYQGRWPDARAVPLRDAWAIDLRAPYPMPEAWTDLERVLEVTRAGAGGNLWTLAVFLSRGLSAAEPEACRAAAERWALTVAETGAVRPVEGPVCLTGASGETSLTWSVPPGEGWFRVRALDGSRQRAFDQLARWPLPSSPPAQAMIRLGPPARLGGGEAGAGSLAGSPVTWRTSDPGPDGGVLRTWAELPLGADLLTVSLSSPDPDGIARDRDAAASLVVAGGPCP